MEMGFLFLIVESYIDSYEKLKRDKIGCLRYLNVRYGFSV